MSEPRDTKDELRDRLVDRALREILAGETPPDLTDAIVVAAEQADNLRLSKRQRGANSSRNWMIFLTAAATAAMAAGFWALPMLTNGPDAVAKRDVSDVHESDVQEVNAPQTPPSVSSTVSGIAGTDSLQRLEKMPALGARQSADDATSFKETAVDGAAQPNSYARSRFAVAPPQTNFADGAAQAAANDGPPRDAPKTGHKTERVPMLQPGLAVDENGPRFGGGYGEQNGDTSGAGGYRVSESALGGGRRGGDYGAGTQGSAGDGYYGGDGSGGYGGGGYGGGYGGRREALGLNRAQDRGLAGADTSGGIAGQPGDGLQFYLQDPSGSPAPESMAETDASETKLYSHQLPNTATPFSAAPSRVATPAAEAESLMKGFGEGANTSPRDQTRRMQLASPRPSVPEVGESRLGAELSVTRLNEQESVRTDLSIDAIKLPLAGAEDKPVPDSALPQSDSEIDESALSQLQRQPSPLQLDIEATSKSLGRITDELKTSSADKSQTVAISEQSQELERLKRRLSDLRSRATREELVNVQRELARRNDRFQQLRKSAERASGDAYAPIYENPFVLTQGAQAVSTFSVDVDTASYANVRQYLFGEATLPPPDSVRLEEMVNYFAYDYMPPTDDDTPFASSTEISGCPWSPNHRLVRIGIKGREIASDSRPASNLVFLVDVSGSMNKRNKLPLVVEGLRKLTNELTENDRVSIVVYASGVKVHLPSTSGDQKGTIFESIGQLRAGGSTAGGAGIQLAYELAKQNFIDAGTNRVLLCTDGDFNVGVQDTAELERLAEAKAKEGTFLTVLGFGRGNLNDEMLERISNKGNGNYYYIDNSTEARKVLVDQMTGTLVTIAKDVKLQVEFNPTKVAAYRLLGYENRVLATQDFNDDTKDAGEIGAGHSVTALYEIVPSELSADGDVATLKYQPPATESPSPEGLNEAIRNETLTLKIRYKQPDGETSKLLTFAVSDEGKSFSTASHDFQFASSVIGFGLLLRDSQYKGTANIDAILELATAGATTDEFGYRQEFLTLIKRAKDLGK